MLGLVIIGFLFIIALEVPPLVQEGQRRALWAFSGMLLLGFFLTVAKVARWPIPNPVDYLILVFGPFAKLMGLE